MATKNMTAFNMTSDLIRSAMGQAPAADVTPQAPAETPDPVPANTVPPPAATPPAPADTPPPKPFDASAIQNRFTQNAPPPAPKDTVTPTEPPLTPPSSPEGKEGFAWAKLRTDMKKYQADAEKFHVEAETAREEAKRAAEEKAALAAELETRKQREQELVEKVGRLSLAESPEFQQKYDLKLSEIQAKLGRALVKFAGTDEKDAQAQALQILSADPAKLPDLLSDLNPSVAGMILGMTSEAAAVDEARTQELANWRQTGAAASVETTRRSVVEQAEARRKLSAAAIESAKAFGNPVYAAEDPRVREIAASIEQEFHGFVQTATEEQLIRAASEGYTAPYLYDVLNQQQAEIAELRNQLAGRTRAANPPIFAAPAGVPPAHVPPAPPPNVVPASTGDSARDYASQVSSDLIRQFAGLNSR